MHGELTLHFEPRLGTVLSRITRPSPPRSATAVFWLLALLIAYVIRAGIQNGLAPERWQYGLVPISSLSVVALKIFLNFFIIKDLQAPTHSKTQDSRAIKAEHALIEK